MKSFTYRHIGSKKSETNTMLQSLSYKNMESFIADCIPDSFISDIQLEKGVSEEDLLKELRTLAKANVEAKSFIGQGYYGAVMPAVLLRNVFENPNWYTAYTPYQAEISQGRLESLFLFQTMVAKLSGMDFANASLLDEATAAAEAMLMAQRVNKTQCKTFCILGSIFDQTFSLLQSKARPLGIEIKCVKDVSELVDDEFFALFVQYPSARGGFKNLRVCRQLCDKKSALLLVAADLLSLYLLEAPGKLGADVVVGSSQRFGLPMGFGGPHAAFFATKECFKRQVPGRIVGLSKDKHGNSAYRLSLVTREQHIRRDKATSNICTAQALLANLAVFYAIWHGQDNMKILALRCHQLAYTLFTALLASPVLECVPPNFDTLTIVFKNLENFLLFKKRSNDLKFLFYFEDTKRECRISFDECSSLKDVETIINLFSDVLECDFALPPLASNPKLSLREDIDLPRIFNNEKSEFWMLRWLKSLVHKDYNLCDGMIPLGSCTMKCNASIYMQALSWPEFSSPHPFVPNEYAQGYFQLISRLEQSLLALTGMDALSFQPNAGANGEYAGLLAIRDYFLSIEESQRQLILIPMSAHGTNPASAKLAGFEVKAVKQLDNGYLDLNHLDEILERDSEKVAALMLTYPSTFGIFEEDVKKITSRLHDIGAKVYLDGANMNAMLGLVKVADLGFDVMHLNLHKTFSIPHGGGGPGVGPVLLKSELADFLPQTTIKNSKIVSAAPYGSALILLISYAYIRLMGKEGLKHCGEMALLHANYLANELEKMGYLIPYKNQQGRVAHEAIVDFRCYKKVGVSEVDVAKRLMDYGFHAPTMSWPVVGTMMIEPTESEDLEELQRFLESMRCIRKELDLISPDHDIQDHPLYHSPFTNQDIMQDHWPYVFSRQKALPLNRSFASVNRLNDKYGDLNFCACLDDN